jgi:hypothetical protein
MKLKIVNIFWGIVLIALGVVFLFNETGVIDVRYLSDMVWTMIFAIASAFFLITYLLKGVHEWGWLFPASIFAAIALIIGLDNTRLGFILSGAPVLFAVAVPFLVAFFIDTEKNQWALIPAWVMTALTMVVLFERYVSGSLIGAFVLYSVGLPFLVIYLRDKSRRWALIPFLVLMVVGTIPLMESFIAGDIFDILVVLLLAVPFFVVYFWSKQNWWALIPAGVFTSIALGLGIEEFLNVSFPAEIFLGGVGLTFGVLWLLRDKYSTDWAKYPALVMLIIAAIVLVTGGADDIVGPVVLIAAGVTVLALAYFRKPLKGEAAEKKSEE